MELHCLPTETPTAASSCSTDPPYDNCPPLAQRGGEMEMESKVVCPAVTRLSGPCCPLSALAPAEVPILVSGGRGAGVWPDHSYCSWRGELGRQGWEVLLDTVVNRTRGGEQGGGRGLEDKAPMNQSPIQSQSEEHRSALSLYDNLPDGVTPDSLREALDMETTFQDDFQEQMFHIWAPDRTRGQTDDEGMSDDKSTWSSLDIILTESGPRNQYLNQDQGKKHEQEPELDSGTCGFKQGDQMLLPVPATPPQQHLAVSSPQLSQTSARCQVVWPPVGVQQQEQQSQFSRVPPPVPLADPSASALRSLLTSFQQQILKQRDEYEARIVSLEHRNEELQKEVVRLKTNLAQQRHWYQVVQAKIAESDGARAAAELHNATLQKEMEQFLDTFGELNNEAKKTECIVKSF